MNIRRLSTKRAVQKACLHQNASVQQCTGILQAIGLHLVGCTHSFNFMPPTAWWRSESASARCKACTGDLLLTWHGSWRRSKRRNLATWLCDFDHAECMASAFHVAKEDLLQGWVHGIHAVPSLRQLHVHLLTADMDSVAMKILGGIGLPRGRFPCTKADFV